MMNYIKNAGIKFTRTPTRRSATKGIVLHHPAAYTSTPAQIHQWHLAKGWIGAGYNFLVRKNGDVFELRPRWSIGAHAGSKVAGLGTRNNSETIGICFEGYYSPRSSGAVDKEMPKAQFDAGVRLLKDLKKEYPTIEWIRGHKEMPGASTACPGSYFPLDKIRSGILKGESNMVLRKGMKSNAVKELQQKLITLGYGKHMQPYGADGSFGAATERAVMAFQKDRKIAVDGIAGPDTQNNLAAALQSQKNTNVDKKLAEAKKLAQQIINL